MDRTLEARSSKDAKNINAKGINAKSTNAKSKDSKNKVRDCNFSHFFSLSVILYHMEV